MHFPILSSCAGNGAAAVEEEGEGRRGEGEPADDTVSLMVATTAAKKKKRLFHWAVAETDSDGTRIGAPGLWHVLRCRQKPSLKARGVVKRCKLYG